MTRNIEFSEGEFYHIYNRGTEKRKIFLNKNDYDRFMILLYLCNSDQRVDLGDFLRQGLTLSEIFEKEKGEELVNIGSFCLMPNHFHILLKEVKEKGISLFMQKLQTAYTMYFNKKYERTGSLFQGTFKGQHLNKDNYLKYIFAYINLNPISLIDSGWKEEGIKNLVKEEEYLFGYKYSSFIDLCGEKRIEDRILCLSNFPNYFQEINFKDFIREWLNFKKLEELDKV